MAVAPHRQIARLFHRPAAVTASGTCLGLLLNRPPSCCAESDRQKRKRPPKFGASVPIISTRGIIIQSINIDNINSDREDCPMCKKFGSGPCGSLFKQWLDCTDKWPGKDSKGQPLHLSKCSEFAMKLSVCLDDNSDYYTKYDERQDEKDRRSNDDLKAAWSEFVKETEEQLTARVYKSKMFPANIAPTVQVKKESKTAAAYFAPKNDDGSSIIVAYIIDDNGNVLAAGSKDDMDMGSEFGCVLMFDLADGMKFATCKAIYDEEDDSVTVFSKTMLVPVV